MMFLSLGALWALWGTISPWPPWFSSTENSPCKRLHCYSVRPLGLQTEVGTNSKEQLLSQAEVVVRDGCANTF